jgi:hypothetical protein
MTALQKVSTTDQVGDPITDQVKSLLKVLKPSPRTKGKTVGQAGADLMGENPSLERNRFTDPAPGDPPRGTCGFTTDGGSCEA